MTSKEEINRYLFYKFDMELDGESPSDVTESWPFELEQEGTFTHNRTDVILYRFKDLGEEYFLIDGQNLAYFPVLDFDMEAIRLELLGSLWVEQHEYVKLDGNYTTEGPAFEVKEKAILKLAKKVLGKENPHILEGLYFFDGDEYYGLVQYEGDKFPQLISEKIHVKEVKHPTALPIRRIHVALGELVESGTLTID